MDILRGLFGSAESVGSGALLSAGETGAALLVLFALEAVFVAWLVARSRRRGPSSLVDGAQRLGHKGRSAQPYLTLRFR